MTSINFGGKAEGKTIYTLLEGENIPVNYEVERGYRDLDWYVNQGSEDVLSIKSSRILFLKSTVTVSAKQGMGRSEAAAHVGAHVEDLGPAAYDFRAANVEGNKKVRLSFRAKDIIGLKAYAVSQASSSDAVKESEWIPFENAQPDEVVSVTTEIDKPGKYYVYVKDTGDNIAQARYEEVWDDEKVVVGNSYSVYQIDFQPGTTTSVSMDSLLKVENSSIPLPANTFKNEGYAFKNW